MHTYTSIFMEAIHYISLYKMFVLTCLMMA